VVRRLRAGLGEPEGVRLETLSGDLYAVADLLDRAERFIFVDAVVGEPPGEIVIDKRRAPSAALPASLHQADIATVLRQLEALASARPFPTWALWGVTIRMPRELGQGLSEPVERAVVELTARLGALIRGSTT
jgi:hydrogenase maturation protease